MKDCKTVETYMASLGLHPESSRGDSQDIPAGYIPEDIDTHVNACASCRNRYGMRLGIYRTSIQMEQETEAVMKTIDWEANAEAVSLGIRFKHPSRTKRVAAPRFALSWKLAVPAMATVFLMGIWLGWFLFYNPGQDDGPMQNQSFKPQLSLARLETALAKKELDGYFKQTQLLLTDLMRQCGDDEAAADFNRDNMKRVRELLNKNRYFDRETTNPQLLSTRHLLKKIEWLLYEMAVTGENMDCDQLNRLQEYVRRERLMLKIRLVGKDISYSEV